VLTARPCGLPRPAPCPSPVASPLGKPHGRRGPGEALGFLSPASRHPHLGDEDARARSHEHLCPLAGPTGPSTLPTRPTPGEGFEQRQIPNIGADKEVHLISAFLLPAVDVSAPSPPAAADSVTSAAEMGGRKKKKGS